MTFDDQTKSVIECNNKTRVRVKCGDPDCQNSHGPYLYAYWKHDKKLKKIYVGKKS
ncbi:MAG TPA: hypothetical protein VEH06_12130 [Candidatus Bathyarchaeia archaeon]|nr:hypothetical protein [Candidatus Bathyarchaeia archaeon]